MKKSFKIFGILLAMAAMPLMYSCEDEIEYKAAEPVSGPQVYFSSDMASTVELSDEATSFQIDLLRVDTSESISFSLSVSGETDLLDIPTTVSFSAGSESAALIVGYDPEDFVYDEFIEVTLSIPDEYATPYGLSEYTFSAGMTAPWISLGLCTYTDDVVGSLYGEMCCLTWEVEIEENSASPGLFRLVNPYDEKYEWNDPGDWDPDNDYYLTINAVDPDRVYIPECDLGVNWGYGNMVVWSYADYYMSYGYTPEQVDELGYFGTYKDGVITFPDKALLTYEADYPDDLYYGNYYGHFMVVMPGAIVADYSVEVDYVGKFTDTDKADFAVGEVTFVGEDVASAHVALFEGRDGDAAVEAIMADEVDCVEITESGNVAFPCEETGYYTIAVVSYNESGEPQESDYASFRFEVGSEETWSLYGTGNYQYSGFFFEDDDPGLELYQSDTDPTRFKIEHWGGDTDFVFSWDQTANEIYVDSQSTGVEYGTYGAVNVRDIQDYTGMAAILGYATPGYYEDGVFNFAVQYYCGSLSFGYGFETFTLAGETAGPALADICGTFAVYEFSGYYGQLWAADYVLEESDNASLGNIMFTMFDDFDCDISGIYGTYDEETGIAEFELDQLFGSYYGYEISFTTYYGSPAKFLFFKDGNFWGPFYGDYITEEMYYGGAYYSDWDAYEFMYGWKEDVQPGSVKPASISPEKVQNHPTEPAKGEFGGKNVNYTTKPVKNAVTTVSYNFVSTVEVKACPRTLDKTHSSDLQRVSLPK